MRIRKKVNFFCLWTSPSPQGFVGFLALWAIYICGPFSPNPHGLGLKWVKADPFDNFTYICHLNFTRHSLLEIFKQSWDIVGKDNIIHIKKNNENITIIIFLT